jgi:hypothetical protein
MKKIQEIGFGSICKKCKEKTIIRTKKGKIKPKNYYKKWEYCPRCTAVYFNKEDKVAG